MRQKLRRRRGDGDESARREPAGTAGKIAASGTDRAITAGASERDAADPSQAELAGDADSTAQGAASSGQAAGGSASGGADRIWHSPAAGLPTPVDSAGGNRSRQGETAEPSKPAAKGTYRVLTEEVAARSGSATGGTDRPAAGETSGLSTSGTEGTDPAGGDQTAALAEPGAGGADGAARPANGDTAALSRVAVSDREPRPAVGDIAGRTGHAADAGMAADDAGVAADDAGPAQDDTGPAQSDTGPAPGGAALQGNGAAGMLRTARSGSHEPLLGDAAALRANWQRVQGDFVDDPRAAVSNAADLVEHTAQALVGALRQRQQELRGLWDETLAGDAGAARDGGWLAGGRVRRDRPRHRGRQGAGPLPGWLGRGGVRAAGRGGERLADGTPDGEHPPAASLPDAGENPEVPGVSPEAPGGTPAADTTEHLRLVMQRYRALFNQICRP